jgi:pimeloyl-ACP methyl ester carboxylesterase
MLGDHDPLAAACHHAGFATVQLDLSGEAHEVDKLAALFADAVLAVADDQALRGRPIGYFGDGVGGAAALIAASLHPNDVAAVATLDAPLELVGTHLSGVRAPTLLMVDPVNEVLVERTRDALPPLPNTSAEMQLTADLGVAAQWFDRYLRGVMRGMRRELWRSA